MRPRRLTQDEARALVEREGSQRAAAKAHGVPRHTFRYWLNPEPHRARMRAEYHADPDPRRARSRESFRRLQGPAYNRRLLQMRRVKALRRMAERNRRTEEAT